MRWTCKCGMKNHSMIYYNTHSTETEEMHEQDLHDY